LDQVAAAGGEIAEAAPAMVIDGCGVGVLLPRDHRFLLVHNVGRRHTWWSLPGGRLETGETLGEAAIREAREETGLEIRLGGLLWLRERVRPTGRSLSAIFLGEVVGGREDTGGDPVGVIGALRWVTLEEAAELIEPELLEIAVGALDCAAASAYLSVRE